MRTEIYTLSLFLLLDDLNACTSCMQQLDPAHTEQKIVTAQLNKNMSWE